MRDELAWAMGLIGPNKTCLGRQLSYVDPVEAQNAPETKSDRDPMMMTSGSRSVPFLSRCQVDGCLYRTGRTHDPAKVQGGFKEGDDAPNCQRESAHTVSVARSKIFRSPCWVPYRSLSIRAFPSVPNRSQSPFPKSSAEFFCFAI